MLEPWDFSAIVVISAGAGAVASALVCWLRMWHVEAEMRSLKGATKGVWGNQKREEYAAEMEEVLAKAAIIAKGEGTPQQKAQALAGLAAQYPRVALKLAKKMGASEIGSLLGGEAA